MPPSEVSNEILGRERLTKLDLAGQPTPDSLTTPEFTALK